MCGSDERGRGGWRRIVILETLWVMLKGFNFIQVVVGIMK